VNGSDFLVFVSGLGIFLFGLDQLEHALNTLSSRSLKLLLRKHTTNPIKAIAGGTCATAILQSSSVVGLMTLAFVGAGILDMRNALGIILGSNLGTTFTGWVVATLGFKLNLASFYLPMVGMGCLGLVSIRSSRKAHHVSRLILGLGLLLMGLVLMKDSIDTFSNRFDVAIFQQYGVLVFFLVGVVFTAIIQSSSATMMITLSALNADIITLEAAAALVIGADLGTTGTVMLGAVKGISTKRQVAGAHFLFNLVTDCLALACLPLLIVLVKDVYQVEDPLIALVAFHSTFNVLGIVLFLPFLGAFARLLEKLFHEDSGFVSCYIKKVPSGETEESLLAMEAETKHLFSRVFFFNLRSFKISPAEIKQINGAFPLSGIDQNEDDDYEQIKQLEGELIAFAYTLQNSPVNIASTERIDLMLETIRNTTYAAKEIKDIRKNLVAIQQSDNNYLYEIGQQLHVQAHAFYLAISDLFQPHNEAILGENYESLKIEVAENQKAITSSVYHISVENKLSELELSTLLNVIAEFSLSNNLLLRAVKNYLFIQQDQSGIRSAVHASL